MRLHQPMISFLFFFVSDLVTSPEAFLETDYVSEPATRCS